MKCPQLADTHVDQWKHNMGDSLLASLIFSVLITKLAKKLFLEEGRAVM